MSCALTTGYNIGCASIGGIRHVYIAGFSDVSSYIKDGNNISGIIMNAGKYFYKYQVRAASFEESQELKRETGQVVNSQTASFAINSLDTVTRAEIITMSKIPVLLIIEDRVGAYWLMGENYGGWLSKVNSGLGTTGSDRRGMVLSFTSEQTSLTPKVLSVSGIISGDPVFGGSGIFTSQFTSQFT
jgi:hypothetical protein